MSPGTVSDFTQKTTHNLWTCEMFLMSSMYDFKLKKIYLKVHACERSPGTISVCKISTATWHSFLFKDSSNIIIFFFNNISSLLKITNDLPPIKSRPNHMPFIQMSVRRLPRNTLSPTISFPETIHKPIWNASETPSVNANTYSNATWLGWWLVAHSPIVFLVSRCGFHGRAPNVHRCETR